MMKYSLFIIFQFYIIVLLGQDIHFSMSHLTPINLNPGETGNYNADYRIHLNHRTQWRSITVPYVTFSASFENNFNQLSIPGKLSSGLIFNTDKAGDGNFGTNQIGLAASYLIPFNDSSWNVRLGLMGMWNQNSIDYSKLYFDNQYNGYMYDPSILPAENFPKNQMHYFDFHAGIWIQRWINSNIPLNFGLSVYHINKPPKTFYEVVDVKLDRKITLYLNSSIRISKQTHLLPSVYWYNQRMLNEILCGGYFFKETQDLAFKGFYLGGWFRLGDAAILSAGVDYQSFHIGISYDFNLSPLVAASNGRGGLEIAIRYLFSKPTKLPLPEKHICPTFL